MPSIVIMLLLMLTIPGGEATMVTGRPELDTGAAMLKGAELKE